METAKVDIRKLQVLNDRINQCIDALNQVRLSVHGLSHSSQGPFGSQGLNPFAQGQFGQGQFGQGQFAQGPFAPGQFGYPGAGPLGYSPYLQGISHSSPVVSPGLFPGVQGISPFAGLSHSSPEEGFARPAWADPLLAYRIAQTFPYAQYPFPAVVPIF